MGPEWIVVGIVAVVVIFGVNKLPQIARNVGKAQGEFKKGLKEGVTEEDLAGQQPATPPAAAPPAAAPPAAEAPAQAPAAEQEQPPADQNP
jgi:sec-independent protein translocase protein TatA